MPPSMFSAFSFCDKETWKQQAENELGEKKEKIKSIQITSELALDAYYTAKDLDPELVSEVQNCQKKIPGWLNTPLIRLENPGETNARIKHALLAGADAILLRIDQSDVRNAELSKTLHSVKLCDTPVFFQTAINSEKIFEEVSRGAGYYMKGGFANDPLANWMRSGNDFSESVGHVCKTLNKTKMMREFRPFMVESHVYHDAGADVVQELAWLLSSAVFYFDTITDAGISPVYALNRFFYSVSVGPEYLTEIAKLRALRYLHKKIGQAYQIPQELCNSYVHTQTSGFYTAVHTPETNIIRAASEAMSATAGCCDALTILPFDQFSDSPNEFSDRVARNVSSLLSEEACMTRVADPAAGSYQLEMMTIGIAEAAWNLFLETEEKGGIVAAFEQGFVKKEIDKSWQQKRKDLREGKIFVGVNKYGPAEKTKENEYINAAAVTDSEGYRWLTAKNLSEHW